MLGSVLVLILAFAFIFFVARGCVANQEATQIRKYVTNAKSVLDESSNIGDAELQAVLRNAGGRAEKLNEESLRGAAEHSGRLYRQTLDNEEVPQEFEDAQPYLESALGIRASATGRLAEAASGDPGGFKESLSAAVEDYELSDSIVSEHYLPASRSALEETGQQGSRIYLYKPEPFMDYEELGFDAGASASAPASESDPDALHGVEIGGVEVAGRPLSAGGNVTLKGSDRPVFSVAVTNGGEAPETGVPVEVALDTRAERQSRSATIERIGPKESVTVEIQGFRPGELNETAEVTVEAGPVEYEEYTKNNILSGTVKFGV